MIKNKLIQPFLKWAGGKRYLLPEINKRIPKHNNYCEPFLGGGAVLFNLQPKNATVNDLNSEIINVYRIVKKDVNALIKELSKHKNDSDYFYKTRELDRVPSRYKHLSDVKKAARVVFLNKTCFNGLFRVNSQGQFNAPFGKYKNPNYVNKEVLIAVSNFLNDNKISIMNKSFEDLLPKIKKGDFVYLDPPYDPISNTSSFTGYNLDGFGKEDQVKLKGFCDRLNKRGVKFMMSNSSTDFIKKLYSKYNIEIVKVPRVINSDASKRGKIDEVLITNYDLKK